ncbi:MAG: hypothetical protein ACRDTC_17010 [Pseudonocardiaceae bacterium]
MTDLTSTAATTVVQLLATAAWEQAKSAVGGLWRRVYPERAETVEAELAENRVEILSARQAGDERAAQILVEEWRGRLRRLMAADPQLVDELRRVVAQLLLLLADALPQPTTITMQATAFDDSRVYQAGHDLRMTER